MKLALTQVSILIVLNLISCISKNTDQAGNETNTQNLGQKELVSKKYSPSSEFDHIAHIRKNSWIGQIDGIEHDPKYFIDFLIKNYLNEPTHKKYITDRSLLRPLRIKFCTENLVIIKDTLLNGNLLEIEVTAGDFIESEHQIKFRGTENNLSGYEEIDGKFPFGGLYGNIERELKSVQYRIDDKQIEINYDHFPSINEPELCGKSMLKKGIEAYEDGEYYYVYISGGNAANTYFGKLVFDETGYVTSIFVDYVPLSMYGSFGSGFLGF